MANTGFISVAPAIAAVAAQITVVDTVVDAIRANDFPVTDALITQVDTVVDAIRAVDVPAIDAAITAAEINDKEKTFFGESGQEPLNAYFQDVVADAAPNVAVWTITEGAGAAVTCWVDTIGQILRCDSGATANSDAACESRPFKYWSPTKDGVTTLYFKTRVKMGDLTARAGMGFVRYSYVTGDCTPYGTGFYIATIYCDNDVVCAKSSNGAAVESTDLSAFFANNTWVDIEIRVTASNVYFYIDGTLRATHSTNIPYYSVFAGFCAENANANDMVLYAEYCEVWQE